jgi:hypothetical protein
VATATRFVVADVATATATESEATMTATPEERQQVYDVFKEFVRLGIAEVIGERANRYGQLEPIYRLIPGSEERFKEVFGRYPKVVS